MPSDSAIAGLPNECTDPATTDYLVLDDASAANETKKVAISNLVGTGWILDSATWTYASATTFAVVGDVTARFGKGTKLKLTQTTVKYFYVVASSYSAPNTTVTVTGGSDYTLASAAITSPYYSYAECPQGFPAAFNYTPTGVSATNVTLAGRFVLRGYRCTVDLTMAFTGAITFTTMPTLPIAASASFRAVDYYPCGTGGYKDAGTAYVLDTLFPCVLASGTVVGFYGSGGSANPMSTTYPLTWANGDQVEVHFDYEI